MASTTGWTRRRRYLVDRDFQLRFFLTRWLLAIATASIVVAVATLYLYVFVYAGNRVHTQWSDHLLYIVLVPLFLLVVLLIRWAIRISHQVSGSMIRIREEMRKAETGDLTVRVDLRKKDQMELVAKMLNRLLESVEKKVMQDRARAGRLGNEVEGLCRLAGELPADSPQRSGMEARLAVLRMELPRITEGFTLTSADASATSRASGGSAAESSTP